MLLILDQEERSRSVEAFRKQEKDVLVATDVASKGLDFPGVQHVINYDMPDDVENYGISYIYIIIIIRNIIIYFHSTQDRTYRTFEQTRHCNNFHQQIKR